MSLDEALEALRAALSAPQGDEAAPSGLRASLIDWEAFWARERDDVQWLVEPVIAAKRGHALYAGAKVGKSYLVLQLVAALATGRAVLGKPKGPPRHVVYVDYEMSEDDLLARLEEFGYGPDDDLSHLHYCLLPAIPPLNTERGAAELVAFAKEVGAELVVIDTMSRAVVGEENRPEAYQDFYRLVGLALKAAEIAYLRLDHAGKDVDKGQRGSSAKNDDVDVVWQLVKKDGNALTLKATHRRMGWVPEVVDLEHFDDGEFVGHRLAPQSMPGWPVGTKECADALDALDAPLDVSKRAARALLAGRLKVRNETLLAALKYRRQGADDLWITAEKWSPASGDHFDGGPVGTNDGTDAKPQRDRYGDRGDHFTSPVVPTPPTRKGGEWDRTSFDDAELDEGEAF